MKFLNDRPTIAAAAVAIAFAVLASGCSRSDAPDFIASAKTYIEKGDYKAASIELRNALQKTPDSPEARFLFGKTLLGAGDAVGAETELRKAIDKGYSPDEAVPMLARALVSQGQFDKVVSEMGHVKPETSAARVSLGTSVATAKMAKGDLAGARSAVAAARGEAPNDPKLLMLEARLAGAQSDIPTALRHVESVLTLAPKDLDAWLLKAQLLLALGRQDEASSAYERAIDANPKALEARMAMVSLQLRAGKKDAAVEQLEKMKAIAPNDLQTFYADALIAFEQGEYARANEAVQKVIARRPDHLQSLLLFGLTQLRLGSYVPAEDSLRKVLARLPDEPTARRGLVTVYLRTGRPSKAIEILTPALARSPNDAALLRMAGEAYLGTGNVALAKKAYEGASAVDKGNVRGNVRLAQLRMATGESTRGMEDLESLSTKGAEANQADFALYAAHMQRKEYDKALATVDAIEKKQAPGALTHSLRGGVYLAKRDLKRARASFEKAFELQPESAAIAGNLGLIDLREGNPAAARQRYEQQLSKNPKNEQALLALAALAPLTGGSKEDAKAAIDKAIAANPQSSAARLALVNFFMRNRDFNGAVAAAQQALSAMPDDAQLLDALARAQFATGNANQALETFKRLEKVQPENALVQLRMAEVRIALKDFGGAIDTVKKVLVQKPDLPQAWAALAKAYVAAGQADAALAEAKKLQRERPKDAFGFALEGEILAGQKKWAEASLALKQALARSPTPALAVANHLALQRAGKSAEAAAFADKWIKDHPKDVLLRQVLAQQSQARKDYAAAASGYRSVLAQDPDNAVALNNLAWILADAKDPSAREYAERAYAVAPLDPNVVDTLGWTLVRTGDSTRGLQLLRMASALAPNQNEIRLHLAQALAQSGDKAGARREAEPLTKLDAASPIRAEAEKLLASL